VVLCWLGLHAALTALILVAVEVAFSFDNAIINAKIVRLLSRGWQRIGLIIAVLGMRLLFPLAVVGISTHIPVSEVWRLALHHPVLYSRALERAHPTIAAFGGSFLLMLALYFFLFDSHETLWIERVEWRLQRIGTVWLPTLISLIVAGMLGLLAQHSDHDGRRILTAGLLGIVSHLFIHGASAMLGHRHRMSHRAGSVTGMAALGLFVYLEVMDASFSFDGVIGAFAITSKIVLITIGLGIGALWVRSLTVYMVRRGTLDKYVYLEHGAHYTIAVVAAVLLLSIFVTVPSVLVGLVGIGIICSSLVASKQALVED
jgi:uncharacterized protein